ncbi:MAG: hypothetical protein ACYC2E_13070 [Sulfuricella sp.]
MATIRLDISEIPHGHGLSFKKGVADGLLNCRDHEKTPHGTHAANYQRGLVVGAELKRQIAKLVKA